ncbi:MAG: hypothetical protein WC265_02660 [Dysgonamonadaceae bacterium]|jgi:hypothetical protein
MKRIVFISLLICLLFSNKTMIFAQDIIVLHSGDSIQAKVLEVTDKNISYKKFNYQDGPTHILEVKKIKLIRWQTGEIQKIYESDDKAYILPDSIRQNLPFIIDKSKSEFILDNGKTIKQEEFKTLLQEHNLNDLLASYKSGIKMDRLGTGLLIGGLSGIVGTDLILGGITFALLSSKTIQTSDYYYFFVLAGSAFGLYSAIIINMIALTATLGVSLPFLIIGKNKQSRVINNYNEMVRPPIEQAQRVSLNLGATSSGFGLTLRF